MRKKLFLTIICMLLTALITGCSHSEKKLSYAPEKLLWEVHDKDRPLPKVIKSPTPSTQHRPGRPPSDAIVLFDGEDLSDWESTNAGPAKWLIKDNYMQVNPGSGSIRTKQLFGSCQLHIEWAAPKKGKGNGQGRSNSGVYVMGRYEVQILDSYSNTTYADGQAGAVYGQNPPMVNACREPGKWQTYDMVFHRPIFENGKVVKPATITVLHNGVLIQDNQVLWGSVVHGAVAKYSPHLDKLPIMLQDHGNPVRYRNIWIRELPEK